MLKGNQKTRGQTAIEYVMMICRGLPRGSVPLARAVGSDCRQATIAKLSLPRPLTQKGQTAIEYVMMISATVVFITLIAYFVKTKVIAP
ncbi:hypothetical protein HZC09_05735 [Candidatus Micrarchaeota archaeon]|nr:hypothetical protein [Candidatus Micrarchaeota archaeon]